MKLLTIFLVGICMLLPQFASASTKYALLIGIENYKGTGFASLDGPANDIDLAAKILTDKFKFSEDNIIILVNQQASHLKIQAAFTELAKKVGQDDFVYIHYSGHGSFTKDLNGDERSGFDQTWVSFGARKNTDTANLNHYDILDDELNEWLQAIYAKTEQVVLVSDSCHSATVTRGNAPKTRAAPVDLRHHPLGKKSSQGVRPKELGWGQPATLKALESLKTKRVIPLVCSLIICSK